MIDDREADGTSRADVGKVPSTRRGRLAPPDLLDALTWLMENDATVRPGVVDGWLVAMSSSRSFVAIALA